jgi:alpha-glucoside transport system substrate-binding protein
MRELTARLVRCVLALGLLLAAAGCAGSQRDEVTIMIPWSGDEFKAFYSVVKAFERDQGIKVNVQVTRDLTQQLDAAVAAGAPPDLAMLPSVGAIYKYANHPKETDRQLKPLHVPTGTYLQPFRGLTQLRGGTYAVPVKVDVKSLVWFNPTGPVRPRAPGDLAALSKQRPGIWCLGLESGPTSGWPGADWIADILLAEGNVDTYTKWLSGGRNWNSDEVRKAWSDWRTLVDTSVEGASTRNFGQAASGMTRKNPNCYLAHGALSAMGFKKGQRYDFVPSSTSRRLEVSADFVGMFTDGNKSAKAFIEYLAGTKAQQTWVERPEGFAFSADSEAKYAANSVKGRIAAMLRPNSGYTLCFGAADAMTPDVSAAFYRAVLDYATPGKKDLTELLKALDNVQNKLEKPHIPSNSLCASPT